MARYIVLGNGNLLINIDKWLQVRDFYYPHVGEENHLLGHAHKIGVFADQKVSWINEETWNRSIAYKGNNLVSDCSATSENLKIRLDINDCVEPEKDIFLRRINVNNLSDNQRKIKVFFYHDFHLYGDGIGDTAGYDAGKNIVFHYKRKRHFLINAIKSKSDLKNQRGDIFEYSVGGGDNLTINDANDGLLNKNPIAQGQVDSIISVELDIEPNSEECIFYWICCGKDFDDIAKLNTFVLKCGPQKLMDEISASWLDFAAKCKIDLGCLEKEIANEFKKSILIIRTHIDNHGAIIAATDSDNLQFNRDTYNYVWTRDGALVAQTLQKAGYYGFPEKFYIFCKEIISDFGCFLHKYNPDGSLGSSWHPWSKDGKSQLPIQEDETALVIYSLWDYYLRTKNLEFIKKLYNPLIKKAADFMLKYMDKKTGLPRESYDLWEERQGIFTFTCSTVYAGLVCASEFASLLGHDKKALAYKNAAGKLKQSMLDLLFDKGTGRFLRGISFNGADLVKDYTVDSSLYAIFEFGLLDANDPRVIETMKAVRETLWIKTEIGGLARYGNDYYHKVSEDLKNVPGNPWIVCTAWLGKYYVAKAKSKEELKDALVIIKWIIKNSQSTGIMPEQINPNSGEPISVSPLTWSHSEFVDLVINYVEKNEKLK